MSDFSSANQPTSGDSRNDELIEVHNAEYSALTMRITYWITIQYLIYALAGAYLGFAVQAAPNLILGTLVFASLFILEMLGWLWLQTIEEMYRIVFYIERILKPKVKRVLGTGSFWRYEQLLKHVDEGTARGFLAFERRRAVPILFTAGLALGMSRAGFLIFQHLGPRTWTNWDFAWIGANIYVGVFLFIKFRYVTELRKRMIGRRPSGNAKSQSGRDSGAHLHNI